MRLFIAICLTEEMRDDICGVQECFAKQGVSGNYTRRENLHLTLAFIGEYADGERVEEAIGSVPLRPFELRLKGVGAFGDLWWIGLEDSEPLRAYVKALRHALADAGIPFDRKRFVPHITILRKTVTNGPVKNLPSPQAAMRVNHVSLMRSDRGRNGMIYTELC